MKRGKMVFLERCFQVGALHDRIGLSACLKYSGRLCAMHFCLRSLLEFAILPFMEDREEAR